MNLEKRCAWFRSVVSVFHQNLQIDTLTMFVVTTMESQFSHVFAFFPQVVIICFCSRTKIQSLKLSASCLVRRESRKISVHDKTFQTKDLTGDYRSRTMKLRVQVCPTQTFSRKRDGRCLILPEFIAFFVRGKTFLANFNFFVATTNGQPVFQTVWYEHGLVLQVSSNSL